MRMMQQIPEVKKNVRMTATFQGYNHRDVINDGEMYDTENLSGDLYPLLTNRKKRGITGFQSGTLHNVHGREKLVYVKGAKVYYDGVEVNGVTETLDDEGHVIDDDKRIIVSIGAYVCLFPDKLYFNTTESPKKLRKLGKKFKVMNKSLQIKMCDREGNAITVSNGNIKSTAPKNPTNGMYWIDTSKAEQHVLRQYSSATKEWVEIPTVYVMIINDTREYTPTPGSEIEYMDTYIKEYDTIEIKKLKADDNESATAKKQIEALNGTKIVYKCGHETYEDPEDQVETTHRKSYIIIEGMLDVANPTMDQSTLTSDAVEINKNIPNLDYVTESNNRLWGCKYGTVNGETVNEIYACKLGDPTNWESYMGLSTDSYRMSLGSEGPFTGAITQRGIPTFFKDNYIHQISGGTPSSYQLNTIRCKGVQNGSWRSLAILNEVVYYKSSTDVMAFDGNMPYIISDNLGDVRYSDARAGMVGNKYYISMKNAGNEWNLFTYDTRKQMWYREDNLKAAGFARVGDELYAIDQTNNKLLAINGTAGTAEESVPWRAEFGLSGVEYTAGRNGSVRDEVRGNHYLSRFDIRMALEEGGKAELEIQYDSDGYWEKKGEIHGNKLGTFVLPVVPRRCDHLRFRMKGTGEMKIYSISRIMEVGGDG